MVNWRPVPFIRLIMPLILGVGIFMAVPALDSTAFGWVLILLWGSLVFIAFLSVPFSLRWLFGLLASLFLVILGIQLGRQHLETSHPDHVSRFLESASAYIGRVVEIPEPKERSVKTLVKTTYVRTGESVWQSCRGTLLLYLAKDSLQSLPAYGDRLLFKAKPRIVPPPKNPKAFDYRRYLYFQNIHYQAFVKSGEFVSVGLGKTSPLLDRIASWRKRFLSILEKHLDPENELAVAKALILGYKRDLNPEVRDAYAQTGSMHVLAVSGLHVGLIYLILSFLLKPVRRRSKFGQIAKILFSLSGIWCFALLTGAAPSVCRAATMFSFFILGDALKRSTNIYNTISASAFCLLVFNPFLLASVGFQLSYLAVIGIVYFQPKIYRLWVAGNRVGDYIWTLITVSLAAQLVTCPVSLYYFHQLPLYFWLSGLVVVPAAAFILGSGLLLFLAELTIPVLAPFVGAVLYGIIWVVNQSIFLIQQLPFGLWEGIWLPVTAVLGMYAFLFLASMAAATRRGLHWVLACSMIPLILIPIALKSMQNTVRKELIVYHSKSNTLVDFIVGGSVITLKSDDIRERDVAWVAGNYREYAGINDEEAFPCQGLFVFDGFTLLVLNKSPPKQLPDPLHVNVILVCGDPDFRLRDLPENLHFEKLVFDASNHWRKVKWWKKDAREMGMKLYDIGEMGAWAMRF